MGNCESNVKENAATSFSVEEFLICPDTAKDGENRSSRAKEGRMRIKRFTQLCPGDHIKMLRWRGFSYWHHAIVKRVIDDKTMIVIHFSQRRDGNIEIFEQKMVNEVCNDPKVGEVGNFFGTCVYRVDYGNEVQCNSPEDVVLNAEIISEDYRMRSPKERKKYNFFTNNCEHLARLCKIGTKQCLQAEAAAYKTGACGGNAATNALITVAKAVSLELAANVVDDGAAFFAQAVHRISRLITYIFTCANTNNIVNT